MPRRPGRHVALAAATASLIAATPLVAAEPAFAQYPPAPNVVIDDDTVAPGDSITFTATGFESGEEVVVSLVPAGGAAAGGATVGAGATGGAATALLRTSPSSVRAFMAAAPVGDEDKGTVVLGTFTADENGVVTGTVTIPSNTRPGVYLLRLVGQSSGLKLTARLTVEGDGDHDHGHDYGDDVGHNERSGSVDSHDGNGSSPVSGRGNGPSSLANTGSSDVRVAMLTAAGGVLLLGGGTLVIARRRRTDAQRG
ncbi:hypothetical protein [Streptomyces vastus]|uniref:LPXTG cell wall anchor domain-containing protein n=1 Tax=Streptomyces vastus TaxID=285451 RepID=A0ABP6CVF0_9ACTN